VGKTIDEEIAELDLTPHELAVFAYEQAIKRPTHVAFGPLNRSAIPMLRLKGLVVSVDGNRLLLLTDLGRRLAPSLRELALAMRAQGLLGFDLGELTREQHKRLPGWIGKIVWKTGTASVAIDPCLSMGLMEPAGTMGEPPYRLTELGVCGAQAILEEKSGR
jgi:hypothetical protein